MFDADDSKLSSFTQQLVNYHEQRILQKIEEGSISIGDDAASKRVHGMYQHSASNLDAMDEVSPFNTFLIGNARIYILTIVLLLANIASAKCCFFSTRCRKIHDIVHLSSTQFADIRRPTTYASILRQ